VHGLPHALAEEHQKDNVYECVGDVKAMTMTIPVLSNRNNSKNQRKMNNNREA